MSRYKLTGGKYDAGLYSIATGKARYPHRPPYRLIADYNAAVKLNNRRLEKLKRSRNWHEDLRRIRRKFEIPERGLSPTKLEKWYEWLYQEQCGGDANSYFNLLKQLDEAIDELINKYKLHRIPFVGTKVEIYLMLQPRYCSYEWQCFTGYYSLNEKNDFELLSITPYRLPDQVKTLLVDWLKNGVPKSIPCSLEVKDHPLGKAWRLCCRFPSN